jgi:hypothetical protein
MDRYAAGTEDIMQKKMIARAASLRPSPNVSVPVIPAETLLHDEVSFLLVFP